MPINGIVYSATMMRLGLLICLLCAFRASAAALPEPESSAYLVRSWRNEDGLPHSTINSIVQAHDGYLWLATYVGLVRFDGKRFVQYSSSNVPDLGAGRISCLFEDREQNLWIALESGRLLVWRDGDVRMVLAGGTNCPPVVSIAQGTNAPIWVQLANGSIGQIHDNRLELLAPDTASSRRNLGLVMDAHNQLWACTSSGLRVWRDGQAIPAGLPELNSPIETMARARDGRVWVFCQRRFLKVEVGAVVAELEPPQGLTGVANMLEASDQRLWVGANDGSLLCRGAGQAWEKVVSPAFQGLNRVLCEDREGNIWRGGFGTCLTRVRPRLFSLHALPEPGLDRYARAVCPDSQGNLWAVLNDQVLCRIPAGGQTPEALPTPNIAQAMRTVLVDRHDSVWVGTDGGELYHMQNGAFARVLSLGGGVESISALFEDAEGNLWIGCVGGPGVFLLPTGDPAAHRPLEGIAHPDVRTIAQSSDGSMWFGTHYGGAFQWRAGRWNRLTTREGLPSDYVRCLVADAGGTMWLGTLRGLARWRAGKLTAIRAENGLWNDSLSCVLDDGQGAFWLSSFGGVFRVTRKDLNDFADGESKAVQCRGYDREDGLPSVECPGGFQPAGAKTPDGRLWFPTTGGLTSVLPSRGFQNSLAPPVCLESVAIDGQVVPLRHATATLQVPPGKRRLDFRFTALSFCSPEKVLFRHQLEHLDAEWSQPDSQRTVTYNYVPPGKYLFQVTACNNDGVWNANGPALSVVVQPFFWQTWWFQTVSGLLLAGGVALGVRLRERWKARLQFERLEREHAVERERSRIARDIHDDLGANLTQIAFLGQRVEGAAQDPAEVERWIRMIPLAASRTIQSLDEIVWAINPRHDTLESLANYLSRFSQEFLALASVRCLLEVPTVLPQMPLSAELRHNLVLAAREALQNVVSHARATEVRVSLALVDHTLSITLADDGRGFEPAALGPDGNGLRNMRKRLEDVGGSLAVVSTPGQGTRVTFRVELDRALHGCVVGKPEAGP